MEEPVVLVPYNPLWPEKFKKEKELIEKMIGAYIVGGVHHVGSTAIPGISAKPIIDILAGVDSLEKSKTCIEMLSKVGYLYFPYKIKYEHWFCKPSPKHREFHLHLMVNGSPEFKAKLAFRDYLNETPKKRQEYEDLKKSLAARFKNNREAYTEAKFDFVKSALKEKLGRDFEIEA